VGENNKKTSGVKHIDLPLLRTGGLKRLCVDYHCTAVRKPNFNNGYTNVVVVVVLVVIRISKY